MIQAVVILGSIFGGVWIAAKMMFSGASRKAMIGAVAGSVIIGFLAMNLGMDDTDGPLAPGHLSTVSTIGLMLVLGGLICGISIAVIGIISGLVRYRK